MRIYDIMTWERPMRPLQMHRKHLLGNKTCTCIIYFLASMVSFHTFYYTTLFRLQNCSFKAGVVYQNIL